MNYETALIVFMTGFVMALIVKPRRSRSKENLHQAALENDIRWVRIHHLWKGVVEFPIELRDPENFAALRKLVGFGFINCLAEVRPVTGNGHEAAICQGLKSAGPKLSKRVVMPSEALLGRFSGDPGRTRIDPSIPNLRDLMDESRRVPTPREPDQPPSVIVADQASSENIVEDPPIAPPEPEAPPKVEGPRVTLMMGSGMGFSQNPLEPTPPKKK